HAETTATGRVFEQPRAMTGCQLHRRLAGGVTAVAGLAVLVGARAYQRRVGRVDDHAVLVIDADLLEPLLTADLLDDLVHHVALVEQHRLPGGVADGVAEHERLALDQPAELALAGPAVDPDESAEDGQRDEPDGD